MSHEHDIGRIDRRAVQEGDDVVVGAEAGVELPLVGRTDFGECAAAMSATA
jgi:hypothetical protein